MTNEQKKLIDKFFDSIVLVKSSSADYADALEELIAEARDRLVAARDCEEEESDD